MALFRNLGVNQPEADKSSRRLTRLRSCLCDVPRYASVQPLVFLDLAENCSFLNWKLTLVPIVFLRFVDGHQLYTRPYVSRKRFYIRRFFLHKRLTSSAILGNFSMRLLRRYRSSQWHYENAFVIASEAKQSQRITNSPRIAVTSWLQGIPRLIFEILRHCHCGADP